MSKGGQRCFRKCSPPLTGCSTIPKKRFQVLGKTAIVKALVALEYSESAAFLRASRHVQMEPVWGGQEHAAIHLRGVLLRLKAHSGDRRPHVLGQVFDSLLQLETEKAVPFVAGFLESENPEIYTTRTR